MVVKIENVDVHVFKCAEHFRIIVEQFFVVGQQWKLFPNILVRFQERLKRIGPIAGRLSRMNPATPVDSKTLKKQQRTSRRNLIGPHTKATTSETLRNTSTTLPKFSMASRKDWMRDRFIMALRFSWSCWRRIISWHSWSYVVCRKSTNSVPVKCARNFVKADWNDTLAMVAIFGVSLRRRR
jgi:hypothetical protein